MPTKPKLYVALDGVVLAPRGDHDAFLQANVAAYAKPFLHWATHRFDVQLLTDRSHREALHAMRRMDLPEHAVTAVGYEDNKTDAFHPKSDFYWVDAILLPSEIAWLAQHGRVDRAITVNPHHGVQPEDKERLENALRKR